MLLMRRSTPIKEITIPRLNYLFCCLCSSGKIRYTCEFDLPDGVCGIDLGEVGQTAHLWLNGVDMGMRICKPYRYDLSSALKSGKNRLVIEVSNTLANALKDWFSSYLAIPASGLIGPVRWLAEDSKE